MSEQDDVMQALRLQEDELQFSRFTNTMALELGLALARAAGERGKAVTIDITRHGQQLFHYAMPGTSPDNDAWIHRKNNVVNRFSRSSFAIGTALRAAGQTMEEKYLLASPEYAAHGGAFPLIIKDVGVIGTITVSGLPQQEDHELVVATLRQFLATLTSEG